MNKLNQVDFSQLRSAAIAVLAPTELNRNVAFGSVSAAILSQSGAIYTGICLDTACSLGFCAEHAAVAEMLKHGEYQIRACVAVNRLGKAIPPCGRCRELLSQLSTDNLHAEIEISDGQVVSLEQLLPFDWKVTQRIKPLAATTDECR